MIAAHRALWFALILLALPVAGGAQERWQIGSTPSVLSGTYGTGTRTDILYTPITARRLFADGDVTLVFPFTCVRGTGNVTVVGGVPTRRDADGSDTRVTRDGSRDGDDTTIRTDLNVEAARVTVCGAGDVIVRGRYYLIDERGALPTLALRGHLKVPTASAARGLGTGRPDEGIALEISRTAGPVVLMADAGYTFIGTPAGADFDDTWWYDAGVGVNAARAVDLSLFFEEYSPIVPGLPNARGLLATLNVKPAGGWRLQLAGQLGLTDTAPDHGLTLGASRRF